MPLRGSKWQAIELLVVLLACPMQACLESLITGTSRLAPSPQMGEPSKKPNGRIQLGGTLHGPTVPFSFLSGPLPFRAAQKNLRPRGDRSRSAGHDPPLKLGKVWALGSPVPCSYTRIARGGSWDCGVCHPGTLLQVNEVGAVLDE